MTKEQEQAIQILQKEYLCVDRDCDIERSCGRCDLMIPSKEPILKAYKIALQAIKDLDKMQGIALDLASENDDLIERLDSIRAEIEQKARPNEIGGRGNGKSIRYGLCMALEIIDKYRGESKDAGSN